MKTLMLCLLLMAYMPLVAQETVSSIHLDSYLVDSATKKVGTLHLTNAAANPVFQLKGAGRKFFEIRNGNELHWKKAKQPSRNVYDITVSAGETAFADFRILKNQFHKNKVIAHRGAFKNTGATENSIGSLKHAIALGCEGSEFDIHMSSDSVPFIHHDPTIDSLTIEKTSAAVLAHRKLSNGEFLPTLDAYLAAGVKQYRTKLIVEIKPSVVSKERAIALTRKVVAAVYRHKAQAWVDYISFDYDILKEVLRLDPYARVAYLRGDVDPDKIAADKMFGIDYNSGVFQKKPEWITSAKKNNLTINVWTVNDPALMDWFLQQQVDFITTNEPELLLKKINAH